MSRLLEFAFFLMNHPGVLYIEGLEIGRLRTEVDWKVCIVKHWTTIRPEHRSFSLSLTEVVRCFPRMCSILSPGEYERKRRYPFMPSDRQRDKQGGRVPYLSWCVFFKRRGTGCLIVNLSSLQEIFIRSGRNGNRLERRVHDEQYVSSIEVAVG